MEGELKSQNVLSLTAIYAGTLLLVSLVHWTVEEVFTVSRQIGQQVLLLAVITSFGGMLANFLPNYLKHPLVYFRVRNVLSGHRCKRICEKDSRLLRADLERMWPDLFTSDMKESEQNAYWYKNIYRPVRNKPEVLQAHRSFLLFRDGASGLFLLLVGLMLWRAVGGTAFLPPPSVWSLVILLGMTLVLCQAARQSGDRMVANAFAVAIGDEHKVGETQSKED